jgi:hypothetical protein
VTSAPDLVPDAHFLSAHNPLATAEQRDIETRAMRLLEHPAVARGREQVANRWKTIVGRDVSAQARSRFGELVEEFTFNYVLKAVNGDPHHPKVSGMLHCPPHEWFDMAVPGSRASGGDGPDQHYVLIPVQRGDRYEITGRRFDPVPADIPLTVTGNPSLTMTLGSLDLGPAAAGQPDHLLQDGPVRMDGNRRVLDPRRSLRHLVPGDDEAAPGLDPSGSRRGPRRRDHRSGRGPEDRVSSLTCNYTSE